MFLHLLYLLLLPMAVVCNFDSVHQALVMTVVKTVAFSGAIVFYTLISLVVLPLTATQQVSKVGLSGKVARTRAPRVPHA